MSKKALPLLLALPFVISLVSIYVIDYNIIQVSEDLTDIRLPYQQNAGFLINTKHELNATPIGSQKALSDLGNALIWTSSNEDIATILQEDDKYYLVANLEGEATISVSNLRQTISRSFNAIIYDDGAIIINPKENYSNAMIDDVQYFGEYDFNGDYSGSIDKTLGLDIEVLPSDLTPSLIVKETSMNIAYMQESISFGLIRNPVEEAYITFAIAGSKIESTYEFKIVKDGYNIYSYNDLLHATNYSPSGEIAVMQVNLESLEKTYQVDEDGRYLNQLLNEDTLLFGNYDFAQKKFNFAKEIYRYETTYNDNFISEWNKKYPDELSRIDNRLNVGIHVQKSFYGNGFIINGHNLTYPSGRQVTSEGEAPLLMKDDLFRGPLPFVALGNHNYSSNLIIEAYGQDNSLMYLDGDNITINDLNIRSCDFGDNLNNLNTVGTCIDVLGDNITIKNSQIRNAKNNLRVYSSKNFLLDNSLLMNARQFLLAIGTNEFTKIDHQKEINIHSLDNKVIKTTIDNYFAREGIADNLLMAMASYGLMENNITYDNLMVYLNELDSLLNDQSYLVEEDGSLYRSSVNVNDTYFYQSGIASISLETMFNGPYIYNNVPSLINDLLGGGGLYQMLDMHHLSGVNYPSELTLGGNTKFYDYKDIDNLDVSSIISQNIVNVLKTLFGEEFNEMFGNVDEVNVDNFFPYRSIIKENADKLNFATYELDENSGELKMYVNTPIVYYGGGLNLSKVTDNSISSEYLSSPFNVDIVEYSLNNLSGNVGEMLFTLLARCVPIAIGFQPFKVQGYLDGYLYGETPSINDLKVNAEENL